MFINCLLSHQFIYDCTSTSAFRVIDTRRSISQGIKYRGGGRAAAVSSRNISSERRATSMLDGKKPVSTGTSSQKTRSSEDGDAVKSCATKSRGLRGRRLLSRRENKMARDDVRHKVRLSDETSVASADNNDPIYILRKEIRDWRISGQPVDGFERDGRLTENEIEKISIKGKK